jgi:hypothetical protein
MSKVGRLRGVLVGGIVLSGAGCGVFQEPVLENSPVVLTEIHYSPTDEQGGSDAEFIEIGNRTGEAVDVSGWQLSGVGDCVFAQGTTLQPGGAVVACKDTALVQKMSSEPVKVGATFGGKLKNEGERITLLDPVGRVADQIEYGPEIPKVELADETGDSLQRRKGQGTWTIAAPTPGRW